MLKVTFSNSASPPGSKHALLFFSTDYTFAVERGSITANGSGSIKLFVLHKETNRLKLKVEIKEIF